MDDERIIARSALGGEDRKDAWCRQCRMSKAVYRFRGKGYRRREPECDGLYGRLEVAGVGGLLADGRVVDREVVGIGAVGWKVEWPQIYGAGSAVLVEMGGVSWRELGKW